ncbi:MAG: MFS transporter, partial [Solirubrobacteraceae bacterium]|nr:MFS transporter [Solirubrobacteraceae bacterium]
MATDIETFLIFRGLQGAVISGSVLSRAIVRDIADEIQTARMLSHINMAMSIAPILGPFFGGLLDKVFGWRSNFVAFSLLGGSLLALCWFDLGETNQATSSSLSQQLRIYPELFRAKQFWAFALCATFATGAFYAFLAGAPFIGGIEFRDVA